MAGAERGSGLRVRVSGVQVIAVGVSAVVGEFGVSAGGGAGAGAEAEAVNAAAQAHVETGVVRQREPLLHQTDCRLRVAPDAVRARVEALVLLHIPI